MWSKAELDVAKKTKPKYLFGPAEVERKKTKSSDEVQEEKPKFRFIIRTNDEAIFEKKPAEEGSDEAKAEESNTENVRTVKAPSDLNMEEREQVAMSFIGRYHIINDEKVSKEESVKTMQRNYGLEPTGELNDETITDMMKPRCGRPDFPADYTFFAGKPKWKKTKITYKVLGYSPDMSPCQIRNSFARAFRLWEEQTELTFTWETTDKKADMEIFFAYGRHKMDEGVFDGEHGLLAHAYPPGTGIGGDTHFDDDEFWTDGEQKVAETYFGNADGARCKFPFIFKNREYYSCTTSGRKDGLEWCSTTTNFDKDKKWGFCASEKLFTYDGNSNGKPCRFPFNYAGRSYSKCIKHGRKDNYRWCSTTANYDVDKKMGLCPDRVIQSYMGTGEGDPCHFPFIFNGHEYSDCTPIGRDRPWCSTTENFDRDRKWGFCHDSGYSLYIVAAHEFGHAIGLKHSSIRAALMFPSYDYTQDFHLFSDDIEGIRALYGTARKSPLPPLILEKCGGKQHGKKFTWAPTPPPPTTQAPQKPEDVCRLGDVDAVMYMAPEIFVFKGYYFWRLDYTRQQKTGPYPIVTQWIGGPWTVDAAYFRTGDRHVILYQGQRVWVFNGYTLLEGYPKHISTYALNNILNIDLAMRSWESRSDPKVYFFANRKIYAYDDNKKQALPGFPVPVIKWDKRLLGVTGGIEDTDTRGEFQLFFKDDWVIYMRTRNRKAVKRIKLQKWMRC